MKKILFFILLLLCIAAHAQEQTTHPANETDFIGSWRIILIPNSYQKSQFKNEEMGYSDPCQFFIHNPDNTWVNVTISNAAGAEESIKQCPTTKPTLANKLILPNPPQFKWKKSPNSDGYFYISEIRGLDGTAPKGIIWKADNVLTDIPSAASIGFDLKKGDMIMQIIKPTSTNGGMPFGLWY